MNLEQLLSFSSLAGRLLQNTLKDTAVTGTCYYHAKLELPGVVAMLQYSLLHKEYNLTHCKISINTENGLMYIDDATESDLIAFFGNF